MSKLLMRPGTILVIFIIAAVLAGMINWAENSFEASKNESFENQREAIKCSELNVDFVDQTSNETHQEVFLQVNRRVDILLVKFEGSENVTRTVEDISTNSIISVSAPVESVSEVTAKVQGCDRVFG